MQSKLRATFLTMIISFANSILMILFNMVYMNFMIKTYGSDVNGLISTITQFISLFSIFEGGMTIAAVVATFEPIAGKQFNVLNNILATAKRLLNIIGIVIIILTIPLGYIYIHSVNSPYSIIQTFILMIISLFTTVTTISGLSKYTIILQGHNKEYVSILFALISKTITWAISIIMILKNYNISLVYGMNLLNIVLNIGFMKLYTVHTYPEITFKGRFDAKLIKGTGAVFFQKIANTVFTSTDLVLVSVFISLSSASVYNLYILIFKSISTLLSSIVQAPFNSFGQIVAVKDENKLRYSFDIFMIFTVISASVMMAVTACVIIPFIKIYTQRITDYNYIYPILVILFTIQYYIQIINKPFGILLNASGLFRMQNFQCGFGAVINLFVSYFFIRYIGIYSIVIGSILALLLIMLTNIYQVSKYIIKLKVLNVISLVLYNLILVLVIYSAMLKLNLVCNNYFIWAGMSFIVLLIVTVMIISANMIFNRKLILEMVIYIKTAIRSQIKKKI